MAPPMQITTHVGLPYTPTSDVLERHEYGVTKNRKLASTGGGRAWSEDEEVYLLQTRLQKMPYKHIAAHLKKTELACRLHYHQLSHGSNRRKRTNSASSGSSAGHSPVLQTAAVPSPIRETSSCEVTPPGSAGGHRTDAGASPPSFKSVQLPRIITGANLSPRLPAILPKPVTMSLAVTPASSSSSSSSSSYPTPMPDSARSILAPSPFPAAAPSPVGHGPASGLRLDCTLPPPSAQVDVPRLQAIYAAHRGAFWAGVAAEYGGGVSPIVLEQAWKANLLGGGSQTAPLTPVTSPQCNADKTRISAILGIDANPRSPKEREMVRRLEEERHSCGAVGGAVTA
ncbi:hypothetical protein F4780DRAFT_779114 [Xylariomycetidae sp. FL0641]|nr:hypothetical protein F4780DRAFT_779114 [Xylariomycetidae sp. FL0641]